MGVFRRYRSRFGAGAGTLVGSIAVLLTMVSCSPPTDTSGAVTLVSDLFRALESQQSEQIVAVAPQLEHAPEAVAHMLEAFGDGVLWEIEETQGSGRTTIVVVELKQDGMEAQAVRIGVPVRYERSRWVIQDEVSIVQTFDVVPLDP